MNYLKRAWCSVSRRKGKSLILFAVIFVLGNVIAGAIAIQQSTANVEKKVKADLGATATIDLDYEKYFEDNPTSNEMPAGLDEKTIKQIGELSYVKNYDFSRSGYISVKNLKVYEMEESESGNVSVSMQAALSLVGTNLTEPMHFSENQVELVDGRLFTEEELANGKAVGLISQQVAEKNNLSVGDQMVMDGQAMKMTDSGMPEYEKGVDHPVEIIGIFKPKTMEIKSDASAEERMNNQMLEVDQFNRVYMPNEAVAAINKLELEKNKEISPELYEDAAEESVTPTYVLKSPEDVEAFKTEVEPLLPEYYKLTLSTDQYDQVGGSMKKLSQISGYVVIIAIVATLIIISLVVVLFLRDRKHELGIYLSLGEKRNHVLSQVVIELLIISIVAMGLSLVTGNFLGKAVSDSLLNSDLLADTAAAGNSSMFYYGAASQTAQLSEDDISNAYTVSFTLPYMLTFLAAGMATVLGAAVLPLTYVLRLNPKKIMM